MADERLKFIIEVDKNTGAIKVVGDEFRQLQGDVKGAADSASALKSEIAGLISAGALTAFLKSSIAAAEEEVQALAHLQNQLRAMGQSFEGAADKARAWAEGIQQGTRFSEELALEGLGKAIQRVRDFGEAQKVVKLAMDISVATGKDYNAVLESLSLAAGGNSRGFAQLQREFTGQLGSVRDVKTALDLLRTSYGGAAERSKTLTDDTAKLKNAFDEVQEGIGQRLAPTLTKILGELKADLPFINQALTGSVAALQILAEGIMTSGSIAKEFLAGIIGSLTNIFALRLDDAQKSIDKMWAGILSSAQQGQSDMKAVIVEAMKTILRIEEEGHEKRKAATEDTSAFKAVQLQKDLDTQREDEKKSLDKALAIERAEAEASLAQKNLTMDDQVRIVEASATRQVQIIRDGEAAGVLSTEEALQQRVELHAKTEQDLTKINQQFVIDSSRELEGWVAANSQSSAQVVRLSMRASEQLAAGFGRAFADTILEGKDFAQAMQQLFKQLVSTIVAELMRIVVLKTIISVGFMGATGGLTGWKEGGRAIPKAAAGMRAIGPTIIQVGEGGEGETVVPDSKVDLFTAGVEAARGSRRGGSGGGGGGGDTFLININISGSWNLDSDESRRRLLQIIADEFQTESAPAIQAARRAGDLHTKYSERSA